MIKNKIEDGIEMRERERNKERVEKRERERERKRKKFIVKVLEEKEGNKACRKQD